MFPMRTAFIVLFAGMAGLFRPNPGISADVLDFAVIQPGQPGTSEEAQPVMDALAAYIQKKMQSDAAISGAYFNKLDSALDFLHNKRPAWGIVRLGFYSGQGSAFQMTAIASTRPGGHDKDIWRLVVGREGPADWKSLQGRVLGNMLFEKDAASCLLFGVPSDRLPFTLEGTFHPLRSLRSVTRGKASGAVLDRSQYDAVQVLPWVKDVTVIHTSRELPTSPVVWFGTPDKKTRDLIAVLVNMKEDGDAQTLLKLLQTDGFGPADPDIPRLLRGQAGSGCFPP